MLCDFPDTSASLAFVTPLCFHNPGPKTGLGYIRFRSPLLTESRLISFPDGTEMFQFPSFARHGLYIQPCVLSSGCPVIMGFPIRRSRDRRLFAPHPGLSQLATSFIAS